jgi:hypothetical protein
MGDDLDRADGDQREVARLDLKAVCNGVGNGTSARGSTKACAGSIEAVLVRGGEDFTGLGFAGLVAMEEAPRHKVRCLGKVRMQAGEVYGRCQHRAWLICPVPAGDRRGR